MMNTIDISSANFRPIAKPKESEFLISLAKPNNTAPAAHVTSQASGGQCIVASCL